MCNKWEYFHLAVFTSFFDGNLFLPSNFAASMEPMLAGSLPLAIIATI